MWTRAQLKELGKGNFQREYKKSVIVCIIVLLVGFIFDGGYNSSNNSMQSSINYNYNYQPIDEDMFYEDDVNDYKFYFNDDSNEINESFISISGNGAIGRLFVSILNGISNSFLGISVMMMGIVIVFLIIFIVVARMFILNPIIIGKNNFFMGIRENDRKIGDILFLYDNFKFIKPSVTMFFMDLYTFLWTLLLIIPGIIKSYEYLMIPYILSENPEMDRKRAFELSKNMMDGQKWDTFVLDLSFIGWNILSSITFGIVGIFYVNPYKESTYAELYAVLRENMIQNGLTGNDELPGFGILD